MTSSELNKFLSSGYVFSDDDIARLRTESKEHPWNQIARQILAKALYLNQSPDFTKALNTAAIYAVDREALFAFIFDISTKKEKAPAEPVAKKKTELADSEKEKSSAGQASAGEEKQKERQGISEAKEGKISPVQTAEGEDVKNKDELREIVRQRLREIDEERKKKPETKGETSGDDELKKEAADNKQSKKSKDEILEKFIKTEPSVSRPKDGPYNETLKLAKKSLEDNFDFVSETLAEIYFKQDNPEKAVKIYEQLMLKLPEKKLYFAARIKEIVENK